MQTADLTSIEKSLNQIARVLTEPHYTLTGAADWPLLAALGGITIGLIVYVWQDLKSTMKESKQEWSCALRTEQKERKEQDEHIWSAMKECQADCCPRRKGD